LNTHPQLHEKNRLTVVFRVEPACLGPEGDQKIEEFCRYAQQKLAIQDAHFVSCRIVPRYDNSLLEMEYSIAEKRLNGDQVTRYMEVFQACPNTFENNLNDEVTQLINDFLGY
jgi:hypothetical protein